MAREEEGEGLLELEISRLSIRLTSEIAAAERLKYADDRLIGVLLTLKRDLLLAMSNLR